MINPEEPDDAPCACANCNWTGLSGQTKESPDLSMRLAHGDPVPVGDCPECGAFCYLVEASPTPKVMAIIADMLAYEAAKFDAEPIGYQSDGFGQTMHDTREEAETAARLKGFRPDTVEPVYGDLNVSGSDLVDAFSAWRDQLREAIGTAGAPAEAKPWPLQTLTPAESLKLAADHIRCVHQSMPHLPLSGTAEFIEGLAADPDAIRPGEFTKAIMSGYSVEPNGFSEGGWSARDPEGDEIPLPKTEQKPGPTEFLFATERRAWEACDNHRMFGADAR